MCGTTGTTGTAATQNTPPRAGKVAAQGGVFRCARCCKTTAHKRRRAEQHLRRVGRALTGPTDRAMAITQSAVDYSLPSRANVGLGMFSTGSPAGGFDLGPVQPVIPARRRVRIVEQARANHPMPPVVQRPGWYRHPDRTQRVLPSEREGVTSQQRSPTTTAQRSWRIKSPISQGVSLVSAGVSEARWWRPWPRCTARLM
jgi:hypothetical protein